MQVKDTLKSPYQIAAQNSWVKGVGAYTGEIAPELLKVGTSSDTCLLDTAAWHTCLLDTAAWHSVYPRKTEHPYRPPDRPAHVAMQLHKTTTLPAVLPTLAHALLRASAAAGTSIQPLIAL